MPLFNIGVAVWLAELVKVPHADTFELPFPALVVCEARWLVALGVATDVDVKANVFRHRRIVPMSADVIFADVRGRIPVLFERLSNGDRFGGNIFTLFGTNEFGFRFADSALAVTTVVRFCDA